MCSGAGRFPAPLPTVADRCWSSPKTARSRSISPQAKRGFTSKMATKSYSELCAAVQAMSRSDLASAAALSCQPTETTERIRTRYGPACGFGTGQETVERVFVRSRLQIVPLRASDKLGYVNLRLLELQLASGLVLFEKFPQLLASVQKPNPLLVIQSDRETSKAIHTHASLLADFEVQLPGTTPSSFLFQVS